MSPARRIATSALALMAVLAAVATVAIDDGPGIDPAFHRMASRAGDGAFAAYALERGRLAIPGLLQCLDQPDSGVRYRAAWLLHDLAATRSVADPAAVRPLCRALADASAPVRMMAASALELIADPRAVAALIPAARDADDQVRWAAIDALGACGDARAIPVLIEGLACASPSTRSHAGLALRRFPAGDLLGPVRAAFPVLGDDARHEVVGAFERAGGEAVPELMGCLASRDAKLRQLAADALGRMHDARAIPALLPLLDDGDEGVRWLAANALRSLPLSEDQRAALRAHRR